MNWKRIVVKVGTNVLTNDEGYLDLPVIDNLVSQICLLKDMGLEVVLVSSGAVGAGKAIHTLPDKINRVTSRQVYSAIGQIELMHHYQVRFKAHNIHCAQVLTTKEDFRDRDHFINMKRCLLALLRDQVIPIINENDVISISELMFTDNDELASLSASLINADTLILLTNVAGVMTAKEGGELIKQIDPKDTQVYKYISGQRSSFGRGGMLTKVKLCQKASQLGIQCYIAHGKKDDILLKIHSGEADFTFFKSQKPKSGIKKWIALAEEGSKGKIIVNKGAENTLKDPEKIASLLPIGIVTVFGEFKKGDLVDIYNTKEQKFGVGIAATPSDKMSEAIGKAGGKPAVHYDYLHIYN